jgi:hypothetical protein
LYWRFHPHVITTTQAGFAAPVGGLAHRAPGERRVGVKAQVYLDDTRCLVRVAPYQGPGVPLAEECTALYDRGSGATTPSLR